MINLGRTTMFFVHEKRLIEEQKAMLLEDSAIKSAFSESLRGRINNSAVLHS